MKNKRNVLYSLIILLIGVIYFAVQAQQKNGTHRADFSGEWKSKESISMGGNIVCCYNSGDRMLAKTRKLSNDGKSISVQANAKSNLFGSERSWETVFDKTN